MVCVKSLDTGIEQTCHRGFIVNCPGSGLDSGRFDLSNFLRRNAAVVQHESLEAMLAGDTNVFIDVACWRPDPRRREGLECSRLTSAM